MGLHATVHSPCHSPHSRHLRGLYGGLPPSLLVCIHFQGCQSAQLCPKAVWLPAMPQKPLTSKAKKAGPQKKQAANRHGKELKTKKGG